MDNPNPGMQQDYDRLDADAVCAECGTVNPEGTLFCKTCGNNLRDQRQNRMTADGGVTVNAGDTAEKRQRLLTGLLSAFGLLLILWTVINLGQIQNWLTKGMVEGPAVAEENPGWFWFGEDADQYDSMLAYLDANPISTSDIEQAAIKVPTRAILEGRYFLREGSSPSQPVVGSAYVIQEGDLLRFVARIGDLEIRGEASVESSANPEAPFTGISTGGRPEGAFGYATRNEDDAGFTCVGQRSTVDVTYELNAYRVD